MKGWSSVWRLGLVCAALVVGEALGLHCGGVVALWPIVAALAALEALFGFAHRWRSWPFVFFLLLGLMLAMRAESVRREALEGVELQGGFYAGDLMVDDEPVVGRADGEGMRWVSFPTTFPAGRLRVVFRQRADESAPRLGEIWRCSGWLTRDRDGDQRVRRLWVQGRRTSASRLRGADQFALNVWLARVRRDLSRRMGIGLEDRQLLADINRAMVLGERSTLPWEMRQTFVKAGTIHVFAISGLHVMVIARVLLVALAMVGFPVRFAGVALIPLLWMYVMLIGAPPSAVRAASMAGVYELARMFWRRPDSLTAWEVTLIGFALLDPIGLFGVGSMLSFVVMLGILLFLRWMGMLELRVNGGVMAWLGVPFAAWASGVPIAARVFSRITPGGLLANLVMVPLAGAAVMAGVIGLAASFVSERLAAHVNNIAALFSQALVGVSWAVSRIPGSDVGVESWPLWVCAAWYVGFVLLFALIAEVRIRRRHSPP